MPFDSPRSLAHKLLVVSVVHAIFATAFVIALLAAATLLGGKPKLVDLFYSIAGLTIGWESCALYYTLRIYKRS